MTPVLVHPTTGVQIPPLLTAVEAAEILGWHANTVMAYCARGDIPTMPRDGDRGPWRIITAKLLRQLGLLEEPQS